MTSFAKWFEKQCRRIQSLGARIEMRETIREKTPRSNASISIYWRDPRTGRTRKWGARIDPLKPDRETIADIERWSPPL